MRTREPPPSQSVGWWTLVLLSSANIISFLDRLITAILVTPIKADLHITDAQIALLIGLSFVVMYSLAALPAARLADLGNRRNLIIGGVVVWSASTMACGLAGGFVTLIVLRLGVGLGEAILTPAALSLLTDRFSVWMRPKAIGIYLAAGMIGAGGAPILGAGALQLARRATVTATEALSAWRVTFLMVGLPALIIAMLIAATVREPARTGQGVADRPSMRAVVAELRRKGREYAGLFLGVGVFQIGAYGFLSWFPTYLVRRFGLDPAHAGYLFGLAGILAGPGGAFCASWSMGVLIRRGVVGARIIIASVFILAAIPFAVGAGLATNVATALWLGSPALFFMIGSGAIPPAAIQTMAPNRMRAQVMAIYASVSNIVGFGLGPLLVAELAGALDVGDGSLGIAMAVVVCGLAPPCLALLWWSHSATIMKKRGDPCWV